MLSDPLGHDWVLLDQPPHRYWICQRCGLWAAEMNTKDQVDLTANAMFAPPGDRISCDDYVVRCVMES